jgi:hypothetical protein
MKGIASKVEGRKIEGLYHGYTGKDHSTERLGLKAESDK